MLFKNQLINLCHISISFCTKLMALLSLILLSHEDMKTSMTVMTITIVALDIGDPKMLLL